MPAKVYERYRVIALVRDGMTRAAASRVVECSDGKAEHWVHRFNDSGFTTFEKQPNHSWPANHHRQSAGGVADPYRPCAGPRTSDCRSRSGQWRSARPTASSKV
jgi:hypothetical protein